MRVSWVVLFESAKTALQSAIWKSRGEKLREEHRCWDGRGHRGMDRILGATMETSASMRFERSSVKVVYYEKRAVFFQKRDENYSREILFPR